MAKFFHNSVGRKSQPGPIRRPEGLPPRFQRLVESRPDPKFNFRPISPANTFDPDKPRLIDQFINRDENYWRHRVTLKLDLSFDSHSYVIGRQGRNTQAVMRRTGCHIHFPDCNRDPTQPKSNQVSIAGPMRTVEEARVALRDLAPLCLTFIVSSGRTSMRLSEDHPAVQEVLATQPVSVLIRTDKLLGCAQVIVRGNCQQTESVRIATAQLAAKFCGKTSPVTTSMEVILTQQNFLFGPKDVNIEAIRRQTGAEISLPHRCGTTLTLSGSIEAVIAARQMLIDLLPIVMIFELPDNHKCPDVEILQAQLGVQICVKAKSQPEINESSTSVIVKGPEGRINDVFEVRRHFLFESECDLEFIEPPDSAKLGVKSSWGRSSLSPSQPVPYYKGLTSPYVYSPNGFLAAFESSSRPPSSGYASQASREPTPIEAEVLPESPLATAIVQSAAQLKRPTYEDAKVSANKAINNKPSGVPRRPNAEFSGFGFSSSMPAHIISMAKANAKLSPQEETNESGEDEEVADKIGPWRLDTPDVVGGTSAPPRVNLNSSAYFDSIPSGLAPITGREELPQLLNNLKLTKYIDLFRENEIEDVDTFASLSEEELREIGVKADWPRKRMFNAINTLRLLARQKK